VRRRRRAVLQRIGVGHGRPRLHVRPHDQRCFLPSSCDTCLVAYLNNVGFLCLLVCLCC
jgi:hypothetical protein